jgi:hypothetical protein
MAEKTATLTDVIKTLKSEGLLTRNSGTNSIKSVKEILAGGDEELTSTIEDLVGEFRQNRLDAEEARREAKTSGVPSRATPDAAGPQKADFGFKDFGIGGILTAIGGAITGAAVGFMEGAAKFFRPITKFFTDNPIVRSVKKMFDNIKDAESGFRKGLNDKVIQPIKDFGSRIAKVFEPITQFFQGSGDDAFKRLRQLKTIFGGFFDVFRNVFSKLFVPIQFIIGLIEGVVGAFKGFERQEGKGIISQIFGAVMGAVSGIAAGIIGGFVDLLKSATSWIAGALGFKEVEKSLDSFSFYDMIIDGWNQITDGIIKLFKDPGKWIDDLQFDVFIESVTKDLSAFFGSIPGKVKESLGGFAQIDFGGMAQKLKESTVSLIALPFDAVKDAVAFLIRKFKGDDEMASQVESFSFKEVIGNALETLYDFLTYPIHKLEEAISSFSLDDIGNIAQDISNKFKEFVRSQLPDPDSILAKFIPDAVYEWANGTAPQEAPAPAPAAPAGEPTTSVLIDGERKQLTSAQIQEAQDQGKISSTKAAAMQNKLKMQQAPAPSDDARTRRVEKLRKTVAANPDDENSKRLLLREVSEGRRAEDPGLVTRPATERGLRTRPVDAGRPVLGSRELQTARMGQAERESREVNTSSTNSAAVNVSPIDNRTTVNNNTSTAAVMSQNMPTVDMLDRSYSF